MAANNFAHLFAKKTWATPDVENFFTGRQVKAPNCLKPLRNNILGAVRLFELPRSFVCKCQSTHALNPTRAYGARFASLFDATRR